MKFILLQLLWAGRKIVQIGQTELRKPNVGFLRLPEGVRGYVERRSLFETQGFKTEEIRQMTNFFLKVMFLFYIVIIIK